MASIRTWHRRCNGINARPIRVLHLRRSGLAFYEHGNGVRQDNAEALRWFRRAAEAGNATGLNNLGTFYRRGLAVPVDYGEAMQLFRQAADKGNTMALFNIGLLYADGQGVPTDKAQAREWFAKAAAAGNEPAIARLARIEGGCSAGGAGGPAGNRSMARQRVGNC